MSAPGANRSGTTLIVADDHPLYREGLVGAIKRRPDLRLLAECADGREALARIRELRPDVAVLDLRLPALDSLAVLDALQRDRLPTKVVVISAYDDSDAVYRAISAGARAYILKLSSGAEVCDAVAAVARGETLIPGELHAGLASEIRLRRELPERPALSDREIEILRIAAEGGGSAEIASRLHITTATVKTHFAHIYEKLEVPDRTAAVAKALRHGLLD